MQSKSEKKTKKMAKLASLATAPLWQNGERGGYPVAAALAFAAPRDASRRGIRHALETSKRRKSFSRFGEGAAVIKRR